MYLLETSKCLIFLLTFTSYELQDIEAFSIRQTTPATRRQVQVSRALGISRGQTCKSSKCTNLFASGSNEEEDDGWGTETTSSTRNDADERELASLRNQMAEKRTPVTSQSRITEMNSSGEPERDLFIPIFAVVSLAGLFGAYGYEMLRLYSRGELYLPWNQ